MLQESTTTWDLRALPPETSPAERLYLLFLLIVFIVALVELMRSWRSAPLSKALSPTERTKYVKRLQIAGTKLKQWIYITLLACGFLISYELWHESTRLLIERVHDSLEVLLSFRGLFVLLEMTFLVAIFVFLVRWHIVNRIAKLSD